MLLSIPDNELFFVLQGRMLIAGYQLLLKILDKPDTGMYPLYKHLGHDNEQRTKKQQRRQEKTRFKPKRKEGCEKSQERI